MSNQNTIATPAEILTFWEQAGPKKWWKKDDSFDAEIADRFGTTHEAAAQGKLDDWESDPRSALALIIALDQFSRNLHRNSARAFENDDKSIALVHRMMERGDDRELTAPLNIFTYLPLMHSENLNDQEICIREMERLEQPDNVKFAIIHRDIIRDFGRFPHRNAVLGRETTQAEQAFLDAGGFSG